MLLQIKNLNSFYGDFQALYNISIELMPGEIIAIIGANGAGKSTLMRSITGLVSRTENEILFKGNILNNLSPDKIVKRGISMVPEGRKLFPSLTVEENLLIGSNVSRKGKWNLKAIYDLFPDLYDKRNIWRQKNRRINQTSVNNKL